MRVNRFIVKDCAALRYGSVIFVENNAIYTSKMFDTIEEAKVDMEKAWKKILEEKPFLTTAQVIDG